MLAAFSPRAVIKLDKNKNGHAQIAPGEDDHGHHQS